MSTSITALDRLREALLTLPNTGLKGFEGLIGAMLGAIAHASFRLAASGSQGGQDGRGLTNAGAISYEAKLYTSQLSKSVVLNKVAEIIASSDPPDIWILAATVETSTQIVETVKAVFAHTETAPVVLDWPDNDPLPPLALLCAMVPTTLSDFFNQHSNQIDLSEALASDLAAIKAQPGFVERMSTLKETLTKPLLGSPLTLAANRTIFRTLFADAQQARQRFGQPLAPAAKFALTPVDRTSRAAVDRLFTASPTTELTVLIGDQGCGKSWSVAQAWLAQEEPPLLIFLTASEAFAAQETAPPSLIVRCIVEQCGAIATDIALRQWKRRLERWAGQPASTPRLVVVVDGLNERANTDWGTWLSRLTLYVSKIGGRVIATCRRRYFERIKDQLSVTYRTIQIGDFSDAELNTVLSLHGVIPARVAARVRPSLRNPRILGIALELLDSEQIRAAEELSIERLLFEHLRKQQSHRPADETPGIFTRLLADHARLIRQRIETDVAQDRLIFDIFENSDIARYNLPRDLLPVIEERFFETLDEDPTLYRLSNEGLVYGLAIATIRELQNAERNARPVSERLADLIEPIATLDKASEMLFAAALIASVDSHVSITISNALLASYADQQNIDETNYPAFCGIVRNIPKAALEALYLIDTSVRAAPHKDWLVAALRASRDDSTTRQIIIDKVSAWLRLYSLNPEHGAIPIERDESKRSQALQETAEKIQRRVSELTTCERTILDQKMRRNDAVGTNALHEDCFLIVAGLPLLPIAEPLMCWAFGRALNSGYSVPWRDYGFVIQHNHVDWFETREALRSAAACISNDDASSAGRWALVYLLRATGEKHDAERAETLSDTLTKDRERFEGWRRIETYCATDPCDPASLRPDNIDATAERYQSLNPTELMVNRWATEKEHFLQDAAPGLARFSPDSVVRLYRSIAADLVHRPTEVVVLALNWLETVLPILEPETIEAMLAHAAVLSTPEAPDSTTNSKGWVVSQYLLVAAFSHLDGNSQLAALRKLPEHGPPLAQLQRVFRPASPRAIEEALAEAIESPEEHRLLMILFFIQESGTQLPEETLAHIRNLVSHERPSARALAMQISAAHPNLAQLRVFVANGWNPGALDQRENFLERWHGSSMLLAAASSGLISPADAITRITPERYSDAARVLGNSAVGEWLSKLLSQAISRVLDVEIPFTPPRVAQHDGTPDHISHYSLDPDAEEDNLSLKESISRESESDEEFEQRQRHGWERFHSFESILTKGGAELILRDIGSAAVAAVSESDRNFLITVSDQLLELSPTIFPRVANLALRIARALSITDPAQAVAIFRHCENSNGYVRITRTLGEIPLIVWESWHSTPAAAMDQYWTERLNRSANDDEIAIEVLAASLSGRQLFIEDFAKYSIASGHPASIARALMALGYLDQSPFAEATLGQFKDEAGLIGLAAKTASEAYQRNSWSRIWFSQLAATMDPIDFWRNTTLHSKIVDARFLLWNTGQEATKLLTTFEWSLEKSVRRRFNSWKKKREKTLFGGPPPRAIYLLSKIAQQSN